VPNYDPVIIDTYFFKDILNIEDQRNSKKIQFIPESHSNSKLYQLVDTHEGAAALIIPPLKISELFSICKEGILLPPHSTYFEPKFINGFVTFRFKNWHQ
jgi:uncharacterized protein (DUF1015 family)